MGGVGKGDDEIVNDVLWLFVTSEVVGFGVLVVEFVELSRGSSKGSSINVLQNTKVWKTYL